MFKVFNKKKTVFHRFFSCFFLFFPVDRSPSSLSLTLLWHHDFWRARRVHHPLLLPEWKKKKNRRPKYRKVSTGNHYQVIISNDYLSTFREKKRISCLLGSRVPLRGRGDFKLRFCEIRSAEQHATPGGRTDDFPPQNVLTPPIRPEVC